MKKASNQIDMINTIVHETNPTRVILFGSRAKGVARPDSDYDFLVVLPNRRKRYDTYALSDRVQRALLPFLLPVDLVFCTEDELTYWKDSLNDVHALALREGKVLYVRP